ncbi:MAG: 23S ribosomal RNA methyltransferase Erm [Nocardioidaceae bacterium]
MSSPQWPGRHELGQNFLIDRRVIKAVVALAETDGGPLVEWGAGDGALTRELASSGRPLEAVEIDPRRAAQLRRRVPPHVCITEGDILRHAPPAGSTVVSNVPFHITTAVLRRLLDLPEWNRAILIVQWEVARKRAGIGGATLMTAQWWPWFDFRVHQRIGAVAFSPRPSVDGGLLEVRRRADPLVWTRGDYQRWVRQVFQGRGRGLPQIIRSVSQVPASVTDDWCRAEGITRRCLPRNLTAEQWVALYQISRRGRGART